MSKRNEDDSSLGVPSVNNPSGESDGRKKGHIYRMAKKGERELVDLFFPIEIPFSIFLRGRMERKCRLIGEMGRVKVNCEI